MRMKLDTFDPNTYPKIDGDKNLLAFLRWGHGKEGWKWSEDAKCYIWARGIEPVSYICLGERLAHASYGRDSYGILWDGSTTNNWHCCPSMRHLGEAMEWVRGAVRPDLKAVLW